MISELTPVEIKYDEYDPGSQLVLACGESTAKEELCNVANHHANLGPNAAPGNMQLIDWPTAPEPIPYLVYGKLEYGSSSGTVIIPDLLPDKATACKVQPAQCVSQSISHVPMHGQQSSTAETLVPAAGDMRKTTSCYTTVANNSPKHEMLPDVSRPEGQELYQPFDTGVSAKEVEEELQEELAEEEDDDEGGFSLEDIDINSLVLVESQDSVDPNRTFYEIYVSNPDTGQLSEKPLDVPADVIENIRQILEAGER